MTCLQVNGVMNMVASFDSLIQFVPDRFKVFAYGGAMIFPEIVCSHHAYVDLLTHCCRQMAEMRRPMDFWKGMVRSF
jgi:hypothetical protein